MTAALERDEWSAARPGRTLPPGKTRYPFYRRLGGPQGRSRRPENLVPSVIRSRTVQTVAQSLYRLSYRAHKYVRSCSCYIRQEITRLYPSRSPVLEEKEERKTIRSRRINQAQRQTADENRNFLDDSSSNKHV